MRDVVAIIGAVTIFFLTILIWGVVSGFLPKFPQPNVPIAPFASNPILTDSQFPGSLKTDNILGLLLSVLAALSSYRASAGFVRERSQGGQGGRGADNPSAPPPAGDSK